MHHLSSPLRPFAWALFALAALIISIGPSLDALGGAAQTAVEAGETSMVVRLVAAFDVVDDVLDHVPGKSGGEPQQQQHVVAPTGIEIAPAATPLAPADFSWSPPDIRTLASRPPERLDRPPRV